MSRVTWLKPKDTDTQQPDRRKPGLSRCWRGERWMVQEVCILNLWFQRPPKAQSALTNVCLRKFVKKKKPKKQTNKNPLNLGTFRKGVREILLYRTLTRILKDCNWVTSWAFSKYSESVSACVLSSLLKHQQTPFLENCLHGWMKPSQLSHQLARMYVEESFRTWNVLGSYMSEYTSYISNSIRQTLSGVCQAEGKCCRSGSWLDGNPNVWSAVSRLVILSFVNQSLWEPLIW